jgi:hypothetical protein
MKAFNAGDPTALAALYADDARSMPPGEMAVVSRSAIEPKVATSNCGSGTSTAGGYREMWWR